MNQNGRLKTWGDADFARKLVEFANIEVIPNPGGLAGVLGKLASSLRARALHLLGRREPGGLLARRDRPHHRGPGARRAQVEEAVLHLVVAPPRRTARTSPTTLMGRPGRDPRPAPRYAAKSSRYKLPRPPSFNEADFSDKPSNMRDARPADDRRSRSTSCSSTTRAGSARCWPSTTTSRGSSASCAATGQLRNTLIVFLSDNGWLQGQHRVTGRQVPALRGVACASR